jgi:signal transduction histidine kinase
MQADPTRLLLVDDDPAAVQTLSRMLAQFPDQRFATSGADALRLARELTPDLILLDADMPGMTGLEVCDALKSDPTLEKGAVDYVTKPLVAAQVTGRVRARLRTARLAREAAKEPRDSVGPSGVVGPPPARLLIVDDDVGALRLLRHTLMDLGEIHYALRGDEALPLARRLAPDLILLDAHMPGLDGFAVCETLKAEAAFQHVPIVFITRFSDPRTERRAFELGAADFVPKPYAPAVVQARVRNLLELKRRVDIERRATQDHWRRIGDARIAAIVNAASDAIVSHDAAGQVVLANAAAGRLLGARHEDLVGRPIASVLGAQWPAGAPPAAEPVRLHLPLGDGDGLPVEASVSQVGESVDCLTTVVLRDLRDRERLDQSERARIELQAVSRTKSQMLASLAHEMGNPLNGLLGFAQLMAADPAHPLPAEQARRLDLVLASGERLQALLRDVGDLGRFESGALAIEPCALDTAACVAEAVAAVSDLAVRADVALACPPQAAPLRVLADPGRLQQCLANLLSNAIKYNRRGGWAGIEVTERGPQVAIAVRDNGLGLDADQLQHLFEPFNRLGRQRSATPGTGLGLWITRRLVEAMGGELRVESEAGAGCCFTLLLPRAAQAAAPEVGASPADTVTSPTPTTPALCAGANA